MPHALRGAQGESTCGHNQVRDVILKLAPLGNTRAASEPLSLISSRPLPRLADVLTSAAVPGSLAALNVRSFFLPSSRNTQMRAEKQKNLRKVTPSLPWVPLSAAMPDATHKAQAATRHTEPRPAPQGRNQLNWHLRADS